MSLAYSNHTSAWVRERQMAVELEMDVEIHDLWKCDMNSAEIAAAMSIPEALVASRIPRILEKLKS